MLPIITLTAFLASLLTLFSGFGLGTLLMPVAAIFFPVATAVALTALVHLLNNLFKLATLWPFINWQVTFRFGIPALLATIPGALLLTSLSDFDAMASYQVFGIDAAMTPVKLLIGILLILFALAEWFNFAKKINLSSSHLPIGGLLSGFFGGLSGHQGAFRSAFLLHANLDTKQFVACNAAIATIVDVTRLAIYGLNLAVIMAQVEFQLLVAATLAAFAGVMVGKAGLHKVTIDAIQKLVALLLFCIGGLLMSGIL